MNQLGFLSLEVDKNGRNYRCSLPLGAPYAEAHEAILEFAQKVIELSKLAAEQQKLAQEEATATDVAEPEVVS